MKSDVVSTGWVRLTQPARRVLRPELRKRSARLAALHLVAFLLALPLALLFRQALLIPAILGLYIINRLGYINLAARLSVYSAVAAVGLAGLGGSPSILIWLIIPLLCASFLFSLHEQRLLAVLVLLVALVDPMLRPGQNLTAVLTGASGAVIVAALLSLLLPMLFGDHSDPIERILGEQEQTFRQLIENSPDFVYIWEPDTDRIPYFNRDGFLGYTREELATPGFLASVTHEDDWPTLRDHWQTLLNSGTAAPLEYRISHKQGHWEWVERHSTVLVHHEEEPGDTLRVLILLRLITERKAREIELRQQEARNSALLSAIPDMIVRMDGEGNYREVWPFKAIRDRRPDRTYNHLVGKNILDVLESPVSQQILDRIQQTLDSDETQFMTYELNEADGRHYYEAHWVRYGENEVLATIRDISRRREDEVRLQREASIFRHVVEAIIETEMIGPEPYIINMNKAAQDLYGWSLDEARGKSFLEVIQPQYSPDFPRDRVRETLIQQGHWASEVLHHHRDGRPIPVYNSSSMWFDSDGSPSGVITIALDLTQQKATEAALKMAEDRFHTALKNTSIVVSNQDRDLRYTWMHDPAPDFDLDQVLNKTDRDLLDDPQGVELLERLKRQVLTNGIGLRQEVMLHPGGQERHYQVTIEPLRDVGGTVVGITCVQVDISETVQSELARRKIQSLLQTLIANVPIMVWAMDKDGTISLSEGLGQQQQLGQDAAAIVGQSAYHLYQDEPRVLYSIERTLNGESFTAFHEHAGIQYQTHYHPVYDAQDQVNGLVAVTIDLSERMHLEKNRLELALERERINMLQRFMGDVSHDFKTPLTSIKLSLHLLSRAQSPEDRQRHLDVLNMQTTRLENFMNDLFVMSRFDRGETNEFNFGPVDFNALLEEIITAHRLLIEQKQQHLSWEPGVITATVLGDRPQLDRVLTNLLVNASTYTPAGGEITLRTRQENSWIVIEVQDNGIGIPPEEHERIFQRFYRGDPARGSEGGGMGLGLAIAHKIVEAHGGSISVESVPGEGSTFRILLPSGDAAPF